MRFGSDKKGFSLVEMLIAIAIVLVLFTLVVRVGGNLKEQAKCRLTECTIDILVSALSVYYDDMGVFPFEGVDLFINDDVLTPGPDGVIDAVDEDGDGSIDYGDVNGDGDVDLDDFLSSAPGGVVPVVYRVGTNTNPVDWSSQAMYYHLANHTKTKGLIDALATDMITGKEGSGLAIIIARPYDSLAPQDQVDLMRFVDTWGGSLRYTYRMGDNFPVITSAGPDGDFYTFGDNISSR
jgi:prepilin-type N-terminal cleavage/methylation domain-containing protein